MIEIFLNIIVVFLFLAIIYFLIQYALKFRQERLRLEDHRNEILKEQQRKNEEKSIENYKKEKERKEQEHRNKLANGYKLYKWKGVELWKTTDEEGLKPYKKIEFYKASNNWHMIKHVEGTGYFKSFSDLTMYLNSDFIELKYWEML